MQRSAHPHRVLFVDDEINVTVGLQLSLRKAPFEILTANSPREALALLSKVPVDVVVSDERMPGMLGSEFLTIVRKLYPDTERVILAGETSLASALDAINQAQVFRFLVKPCKPDELAFCIGQAFETLEVKRRAHEQAGISSAAHGDLVLRLESSLASAYMTFQPIVTAVGKRVFGYEALLRSRAAAFQGPTDLLGVAEELGRIDEIEGCVRRLVAARMPGLPDGAVVLTNVHPLALESEAIFAPDNPLHPFARRIVLEIIERSSIQDSDLLREKIGRLRQLGYRIAVDDLGAGYAGLSSFALLVPEVVKFDMELIQGIHMSTTRSKLISSMASLCREMGILTIAEGVECQAEHDHVVDLQCDLVQGFHCAGPSEEFARFD